jgi:hypothetical protein
MQPLNSIQNISGKLKGIRIPSINSAKVTKFFYQYFLGLSDHELEMYQKANDELKARQQTNEKTKEGIDIV